MSQTTPSTTVAMLVQGYMVVVVQAVATLCAQVYTMHSVSSTTWSSVSSVASSVCSLGIVQCGSVCSKTHCSVFRYHQDTQICSVGQLSVSIRIDHSTGWCQSLPCWAACDRRY